MLTPPQPDREGAWSQRPLRAVASAGGDQGQQGDTPIDMQLRKPFVRLFFMHQESPSGLPTGRRDATVDAGRTSACAAMWAVVAANQTLAPRQVAA